MHQFFCGPADFSRFPDAIASLRGALLPYERSADECCFLCFVPKGGIFREPLHIDIPNTTSRLIVIAEEAAKAQVHVHLMPREGKAVHATEIFVRDGAELNLLFLQSSASPSLVVRQRSAIGAGAKLHLQNVSLGSGVLAHSLLSDVNGSKSESAIDWLFYAKDQEEQRIDARNAFHAREGGGEITMKGVAEGRAHSVCTGTIHIGLGGGGTDTYLTEDMLMLDKTAKVDAVPGLEIKTNDVRASHSATVSKVTSDNLFYFASRGIARREARKMYVLGFLGDLTRKIANEEERGVVMRAIERKYGG